MTTANCSSRCVTNRIWNALPSASSKAKISRNWTHTLHPVRQAFHVNPPRVFQDFSFGAKTKRAEGVLGEVAATPSPAARWPVERCELPSGVRGGAPTAQRFPLFSALRMNSPDTIILLIVDYHASVGGQDPRAPTPMRTPLQLACSW